MKLAPPFHCDFHLHAIVASHRAPPAFPPAPPGPPFIFLSGGDRQAPRHCFNIWCWIAFNHLMAYELPGLEAVGDTGEQLILGAKTWDKPFLTCCVLEHKAMTLCNSKRRIWYSDMSICTYPCYPDSESPGLTHPMGNEDFCPQLGLLFNFQAVSLQNFKSWL